MDGECEFRLSGRIKPGQDAALRAGDDKSDLAPIRAGDNSVRGIDLIQRVIKRFTGALIQPADQTVFLKTAIPAWTI